MSKFIAIRETGQLGCQCSSTRALAAVSLTAVRNQSFNADSWQTSRIGNLTAFRLTAFF